MKTFHLNENTPAAHLYHDDNGYRLWCFSEYKMYGSWNIYKTFLPNINTNKLALLIFNNLSPETQKQLLEDLNVEKDRNILLYNKSLLEFKEHKINITQLLHIIADSFKND